MNSSALEKHVVAYVDFLGFREAVESADTERTIRLHAALVELAASRGSFQVNQMSQSSTGKSWQLKANISTFSDHVVISYPINALVHEFADRDPVFTALLLLSDPIGAMAATAMNLGMLIRGGITVGPLVHSNDVVLGPALNQAYLLESTVASYPRIVLSLDAYLSSQNWRSSNVLTDSDGIRHFNYFPYMLVKQPADLQNRIQRFRLEIERNIKRFEAEQKWNPLSKWAWFKNQFESAVSSLPAALLDQSLDIPSKKSQT